MDFWTIYYIMLAVFVGLILIGAYREWNVNRHNPDWKRELVDKWGED